MTLRNKLLARLSGLFALGLALVLGAVGVAIYRMVPAEQGTVQLPGLRSPVSVEFDDLGIPSIRAESRLDAYRALGYITARDRLFQMDLLRRSSGGRLAEVMGEAVVEADIEHRLLGFNRVAPRIVARLPADQRQALEAYAAGVNSWLDQVAVLPFEFSLLGYRPERWTPEDSVLVVLGVFEGLDLNESEERMLTVMEHTLPPDVAVFLTPRRDPYRSRLSPQDPAFLLPQVVPIPVESLRSLLQSHSPLDTAAGLFRFSVPRAGSNAWAVSGAKTPDGRAILANDMHLGLSVPNIWYRYALHFEDQMLTGVGLPGTPLLVAGTNRHLAWGLTALGADVLDLVGIDVDPQDPGRYRVPDGWERFRNTTEKIKVRDGPEVELTVRESLWGPVSNKPLLGRPVALHWTALDPEAVDLGLLGLDRAADIAAGVQVVNNSAGPPLNVILADDRGHIAWTVMGRIPIRRGFDGANSRSWADGRIGWQGYIEPGRLPRTLEPDGGLLVSANDRAFAEDYPYPIAHGFDNGVRAFRIKQQLRAMEAFTEARMLALQLDTRAEFYDFYRQLGLDALLAMPSPLNARLQAAQQQLLAWDGHANADSQGLGLLVEFRKALLERVLGPFLALCRKADPDFDFVWPHVDVPLQALLSERPPGVLPDVMSPSDWQHVVVASLEASVSNLDESVKANGQGGFRWGNTHRVSISHPFSAGLPWLSPLLDMPQNELPGCEFCVRFALDEAGATERLVVSPGRFDDAILQMPGGQSGHPFSAHYRDQQPSWLIGTALKLVSDTWRHTLRLAPAP